MIDSEEVTKRRANDCARDGGSVASIVSPLVNRTTISFVVRSQVLAREGRELQTGEAREGERDGGGGGAGAARRREWWREG